MHTKPRSDALRRPLNSSMKLESQEYYMENWNLPLWDKFFLCKPKEVVEKDVLIRFANIQQC